MQSQIERLVRVLDSLEEMQHKSRGYTHPHDPVHFKERQKFVAIDIGGSGAWLVDKTTGEIYNIMGYGKPDHNKKRKADIGNLSNVDPANMHARRYNYLR